MFAELVIDTIAERMSTHRVGYSRGVVIRVVHVVRRSIRERIEGIHQKSRRIRVWNDRVRNLGSFIEIRPDLSHMVRIEKLCRDGPSTRILLQGLAEIAHALEGSRYRL